jgi:glyoxylase-like metal-dependent hydrolase (beta-lactamase superfamily II)
MSWKIPLVSACLWVSGCFYAAQAQEKHPTPELVGGPTIPADKGYIALEIRDGLYWVSDGAYNTMFLVTSQGVVAIDAPPTLGANYLKAISEVTSKPIVYLIYSHEHTDHIGAAHLFSRSVKIVAQNETAAILASRRDPRRPVPTVTFEKNLTLKLGGQSLVLDYPGINHERGNICIYAPAQKTLMLVDVVYPGYMPYKNLGIAEDLQGYCEIQKHALSYDFSTIVAGHVTRLGTRADVELSMEFYADLKRAAEASLNALPLGEFAKLNASRAPDKWHLHNEYEKAVVEHCYDTLLPRWRDRLADTPTYLRDNCWVMMESIIVTLVPEGVKRSPQPGQGGEGIGPDRR